MAGHPRLDHPGLNKQKERPPLLQDHLGKRDLQTLRIESPAAEQDDAATTQRTRSSGEMWPDAPPWIVRGRSSRRSHHRPDWGIQGKLAARSKEDMRPRLR